MTKLSDILPKKKELTHDRMSPCGNDYYEGYNDSIDDCHTALEQAMKEGKLCWVPSEEEVMRALLTVPLLGEAMQTTDLSIYPDEDSYRYLAQALIQLLKNQKESQ